MFDIWSSYGRKILKKIKKGNLEVVFEDKSVAFFGDKTGAKVKLEIYNKNFFKKLFLYGDIGFAESYMDKDFSTNNLTGLITIALDNSEYLGALSNDESTSKLLNIMPIFNKIKHKLRKNSQTNSRKNISEHYDLSNDFFKLMLDDTMMYSSAVFEKNDESLYEAQKRKIELLANKLRLDENSHVLEIGSGWGSMAIELAKRSCKVTTVTLSSEQKKLCQERFKQNNVQGAIDILLEDYRNLKGKFDAIIAVEMFEAVGREYFDVFFKKCQSLLKPSGVLTMQIITMPDNRYEAYCKGTDFIQKYIFPGGHLPSVGKILEVTSKHTRLNLLHMEEFTEDYAKTLNIWHKNFLEKLDEVKNLGFDSYFIRMWKMYLNYCEAAFLTRNINLVQLVFTRDCNTKLNKGLINEF